VISEEQIWVYARLLYRRGQFLLNSSAPVNWMKNLIKWNPVRWHQWPGQLKGEFAFLRSYLFSTTFAMVS
jgi:hypothetical protein